MTNSSDKNITPNKRNEIIQTSSAFGAPEVFLPRCGKWNMLKMTIEKYAWQDIRFGANKDEFTLYLFCASSDCLSAVSFSSCFLITTVAP